MPVLEWNELESSSKWAHFCIISSEGSGVAIYELTHLVSCNENGTKLVELWTPWVFVFWINWRLVSSSFRLSYYFKNCFEKIAFLNIISVRSTFLVVALQWVIWKFVFQQWVVAIWFFCSCLKKLVFLGKDRLVCPGFSLSNFHSFGRLVSLKALCKSKTFAAGFRHLFALLLCVISLLFDPLFALM